MQTVWDAVVERRQHRASVTAQEISDGVGGPEQMLVRIGEDPRLDPFWYKLLKQPPALLSKQSRSCWQEPLYTPSAMPKPSTLVC